MYPSAINEQTVRQSRRQSRKLLLFLLFSAFAFLSLASSTLSFSAKLDNHPQVRAQTGAFTRAVLREVSRSSVQDEAADYSFPGPDTDKPPCAAAFLTAYPKINCLIVLARKDLTPSPSSPLRRTPLAPRAPPILL